MKPCVRVKGNSKQTDIEKFDECNVIVSFGFLIFTKNRGRRSPITVPESYVSHFVGTRDGIFFSLKVLLH